MKKVIASMLIIMILIVSGCSDDTKTLKVAEQYGLAYAPVTIIKEKGILESLDPELEVTWMKLSNTAAIREAMVGDGLDIGFMGIPPFIINRHNGMTWEAFTGLSSAKLALMTNDSDVKSLNDIGDKKIILPQPGSIQHILLSMAAEKEMGDATAFDHQLISMKHPDGMQVMSQGDEDSLHFTSPPFTAMEKNNGSSVVIDGYEAFGGSFTFIIGVAKSSVFEEKSEELDLFKEALVKANAFMKNNKEETLDILAEAYGMERELLESLLYGDCVFFLREIDGMNEFATFLYDQEYIDRLYTEEELIR